MVAAWCGTGAERQTAMRYAEAMRAGLWRPRTEEPIELRVSDNIDATVTDGRRRLAAVVLADQLLS